jgi:hypothetical protein
MFSIQQQQQHNKRTKLMQSGTVQQQGMREPPSNISALLKTYIYKLCHDTWD